MGAIVTVTAADQGSLRSTEFLRIFLISPFLFQCQLGSMIMETMFRVKVLSLLLPLLLVSNHVNIIKLILPELVMDC